MLEEAQVGALSQAVKAWYHGAEVPSEVELALVHEWAANAVLDYELLQLALRGTVALCWDFDERCPRVRMQPESEAQVA